jgi:hypothetical protein
MPGCQESGGVMERLNRFWVPGQMPGMNEVIEACKGCGGRGYGYSKMKKVWTESVCWHARAARLPKFTTIRLDLEWIAPTHANKAERDRDNQEAAVKFIADGLKLAKVIPDDKPENYLGSTHHHEKGEKPGVWVMVVDASEPSRRETPVVGIEPQSHRGTYQGQTKKGE